MDNVEQFIHIERLVDHWNALVYHNFPLLPKLFCDTRRKKDIIRDEKGDENSYAPRSRTKTSEYYSCGRR